MSEHDTTGDPRFSNGLMIDVFRVLDQHGYRPAEDNRAMGQAVLALLQLVRAYEGGEDQ